MNVFAALLALCKAAPAIAKVIHSLSGALREYEAQKRLATKDAVVDAAINRVRSDEAGKRSKPDESSGVSESDKRSSRMGKRVT